VLLVSVVDPGSSVSSRNTATGTAKRFSPAGGAAKHRGDEVAVLFDPHLDIAHRASGCLAVELDVSDELGAPVPRAGSGEHVAEGDAGRHPISHRVLGVAGMAFRGRYTRSCSPEQRINHASTDFQGSIFRQRSYQYMPAMSCHRSTRINTGPNVRKG
jgi:hypothetical protein